MTAKPTTYARTGLLFLTYVAVWGAIVVLRWPRVQHVFRHLEVTENAIIEDFEHMRDVVGLLRAEGFLVAIDDAGAGYSGLQTMVELEADFIKLDMSLTRGIEDSMVKRRLVKTLRDFCEGADIQLIAEGIETRPQLDVLRELGVGCGQGFLFAHPESVLLLQATVLPADERPPVAPSGPGPTMN